LRRYIDGIAQKQTLSALCGYGKPLTLDECHEVSKIAARASDSINNIQSSKQSSSLPHSRSRGGSRQVSALYELSHHLETTGGINNRRQVKAMSTGRSNEVVIIGLGATGTCKGVKGTLKSGEHVLVHVDKIDPEVGLLEVTLVNVK
jgi:cysteine synthase